MEEKTLQTFMVMQEYLIHIDIHLNINLFVSESSLKMIIFHVNVFIILFLELFNCLLVVVC